MNVCAALNPQFALTETPAYLPQTRYAINGLIEVSGDRLNISDWERLKQAGEFDPTYLDLGSNQAAA